MTDKQNDSLKTLEVIWNLTDLYTTETDGVLEQDMKRCEKKAAGLKKRYDGKIAGLTAAELLKLVSELEELETLQGKISTFAFLNFATRTKDPQAAVLLQRIREFGSRVSRDTVFFELEWNQLEEEIADQLLQAEVLSHYHHYLASLRRYAPHQLNRTEETILLEKAPVGRSSWNNLFDKVMGHLKFGERQRSEEEVLTDLYAGERQVRKEAAQDLTAGLTSQLHILTHIFTRLYTASFPLLRAEFSLSIQQIGMMAAIPSLFQTILYIPSGLITDKIGYKSMLLLETIQRSADTGQSVSIDGGA